MPRVARAGAGERGRHAGRAQVYRTSEITLTLTLTPAVGELCVCLASHGRVQASVALLQAHCTVFPPKPNPLRHAITAVTHPALNAPIVHAGHHTHDGGSARAGQPLQHVSVKMVNSAWAGDVRWVCSRGGWTGTPPRPSPPGSQAACTSCRFPALDGRFERPPPHTAARRPQHDGHLGEYLLLRG